MQLGFAECTVSTDLLVLQPQTPPLSPRKSNNSSRTASRSFSGLMADVPACLSSDNLSLPEDFEAEYGASDKSRNDVRAARRVVVKVNKVRLSTLVAKLHV